MLKKILSPLSCAECRVCCVFDRDDCWEMPLVYPELAELINKNYENVPLEKNGEVFGFVPDFDEEGLAKCPMLTKSGCSLGEKKPFDCKIWPFRVMRTGGQLAITVSPVCETVSALPLKALSEFVSQELADTIYNHAKSHPEMIKPYIDGYPILRVRNADFTEVSEK